MKEKLNTFVEEYIKFPYYVLFHPFDGYEEFKRYKRGKLSVAITFIVLFAIYKILAFQYTGFVVNENNIQDLNSFKEILTVAILLFLFTVGNWSVTTLMEGKGNFKEIVMVTGYSLFPIVMIGFPSILLSRVIGQQEVGIYTLILGIGYFATGWMLFMGILNIHEYGLGKTIAAFLLTIVAMLVMAFFALLFFDLIQQFLAFVKMIWQELSLRM